MDDSDSLDTPDDTPERRSATTALDFEARTELRLKALKGEVRSLRRQIKALAGIVQQGHSDMVKALEGRTRLLEKFLDLVKYALGGIGVFATSLMERITKPTAGLVAIWLMTIVGFGGLTVAQVVDLAALVPGWAGGTETVEIAPAP